MRLFFVVTRSPKDSSAFREAIDAILAAAAFDQDITVFFSGASVLGLLPHQDSSQIHQKAAEKMLTALPVFGVEKILAEKTSVERYQVNPDDFIIAGIALAGPDLVYKSFATADKVLSF